MISSIEKMPWAKVTVIIGVGGLALFTLVALVRLTLGLDFPPGYDSMLYSLVALTGVGGGYAIGKRATDYTLAAIKTGDPATIATVVGPPKVPDSEVKPNV